MEMAKTKLILFSLLCVCVCSCAQIYKWESVSMNGSRTGCVATTTDNVVEALGVIEADGTYKSPSGNVYAAESATAKVASAVIAVQPKMSAVKQVIAYSEENMHNTLKESRLSNWFVEIMMEKVSEKAGKKVDVGICNMGGIRASMPKGDVILDDIKSMFPFRNYIVYLELPGSELKAVFARMAATRFEAVAGVQLEVENRQIVSAKIGGEDIVDDKLYGVATISFLLRGGDGYTLAEHASNLQEIDMLIVDAVLEHVAALTAEGKSIKGSDARYVVIK